MSFKDIINPGLRTVRRGLLVGQKYSPEILFVAGAVGFVGTVILASKATLKLDETLDRLDHGKEQVSIAVDTIDDYSEDDRKHDLAILHIQAGLSVAKLYAPAVTLGIASLGALLGAQGILKKRNVAVIAAYKGLEESFKEYRKKVADRIGVDEETDLLYDIHEEDEKDENGKKISHPVTSLGDPNEISQYARFFDEGNIEWQKDPEYNLLFLKSQQNYANDLLHSRGHLFLNEVYDMLHMEHSREGAVVGWVLSKDGDNYVDFGLYNSNNEKAREFVNGQERSILLDFNVDGVIWDLI